MSMHRAALDDVGDTLVYVYGVGRAAPPCEPVRMPCEGVIPQTHVARLVEGNLVAFLSSVPARQFGASQLRTALADNAWLCERVLAHERTLELLCTSYTLVPFRFCSIYRDVTEVSRSLQRHRVDLNDALDRVCGASEWAVKLYYEREKLRRGVEDASATLQQMRASIDRATPGMRFFLEKKLASALDAEVTAELSKRSERSRQHLDAFARESAFIAVQATRSREQELVFHAAYLVDNDVLIELREAVAKLESEAAALGFKYELTGPWPPYHFASLVQDSVEDGKRSHIQE